MPAGLDDEYSAFLKDRETIRCRTCKLPTDLRTWVEAQLQTGASAYALAEFLTTKGHKCGHAALSNHIKNHVPG